MQWDTGPWEAPRCRWVVACVDVPCVLWVCVYAARCVLWEWGGERGAAGAIAALDGPRG